MENYLQVIAGIAGFGFVSLAAQKVGEWFRRFKLPLISGFLFAGILAGPFVFNMITAEALPGLLFVDEIALAFIAFAAGSELYLKEMEDRLKSITRISASLTIVIYVICGAGLFLLAEQIPFMRSMGSSGRIAVAIMGGAIMIARSPSSAIAIINESRAHGPFTQTILGVTIVKDVVMIVVFAISASIADALLTGLGFGFGFLGLLAAELALALLAGYLLGQLLRLILKVKTTQLVKSVLSLLAGYGIFVLSAYIRHYTHDNMPFEVFIEPLLVCMIAGFVVANAGEGRVEFLQIIHDSGPPIYIAFFTLTGAALALDVLVLVWPIALALFFIRLVGVLVGAWGGGIAAGDPMQHTKVSWMGHITQAGVALGLAKEVAVEFPEWGEAFATVMIAVIVLNLIVGPPLFKWALNRVGEAHHRAPTPEFSGARDVIIFGLEGESVTLARQLQLHDWQVKVAALDFENIQTNSDLPTMSGINICPIDGINLDSLRTLDILNADALVLMLSDEENYRVCELVYEHCGIEPVVVRLNDHTNAGRFHALGALVVDPRTAIVNLLDQFVRSPSATSLLLGMESGQGTIDLEVRNRNLDGLALRELRLPLDVLVLSVHRDDEMLISHGYTQLKYGDRVSMVGSLKSLEEITLRFDG